MSKNVNTNELNGLALEIKSAISAIRSAISTTESSLTAMNDACSRMDSYNGQKVFGSTVKTSSEEKGPNGPISKTHVYWETWNITGCEEITQETNFLHQNLSTLDATLDSLFSESSTIQLIADTIDGYIQSIQTELSSFEGSISLSDLSKAFGVTEGGLAAGSLGATIAYDASRASSGDFITTDKILTQYWIDKPLTFEQTENGSYAIYQNDDKGNKTLMGYTTAITAATYLTQVKDSVVTTKTTPGVNMTEKDKELIDAGKVNQEKVKMETDNTSTTPGVNYGKNDGQLSKDNTSTTPGVNYGKNDGELSKDNTSTTPGVNYGKNDS